MSQHTEGFHLKRIVEHLDPLLNDHHANAAFFYRDRSLRKYVVHAGPRTKSRLEFLLENDADLKKAIKKDDDESNRCNDQNFVENNINQVRGRAPFARLQQKVDYLELKELSKYLRIEVLNEHVATAAACGEKPKTKVSYGKKDFEPWWWKHLVDLIPWNLVPRAFENITVAEFESIKGSAAKENLTETMKEIIRRLLEANNIDPDSHVVQDIDKKMLNRKRRARGKKFLLTDSSSFIFPFTVLY